MANTNCDADGSGVAAGSGALVARVAMVCLSCGSENPERFQFCGQCAAPLGKTAPASVAPKAGRAGGEAERRLLTVMFCDLVGTTSLSEQLDPEDLREILRKYQAVGAAAIERFDGSVAQYLGDGILAYFGYPRAHEDDAQRAVAAGLEIVADAVHLIAQFGRESGARLAVRVAVHTGLVVAGEVGSGGWREHLAVGGTPNVAARLQALAEPNTLVISADTYRLVRGYFSCHSRGKHALKGVALPMPVYQVTGATGATRLDVAASAGLSALVGREPELARLRGYWREVRNGAGKVLLLSGEAGIGKSRLVEACMADADAATFTRLRYFCSEQHTSSPLYPLIRQVESAAGFKREDSFDARLDKLEALAAAYRPSQEELALLADLLGLPVAAQRYPPVDLPPQQRRQRTFTAWLRMVEELAARGPLLMLFEDVHWIDPTSCDLLDALAARVDRLAVLVIVTCRPEFQSPWAHLPHAEELALGRLDQTHRRILIEQIAGSNRLPERTLRNIAERSDGVPLFIEELTNAVLETEQRSLNLPAAIPAGASDLAVPVTLHSSLLARLDRLGATAKEVAQIGSAIGRQFYYRLLAAVAGKAEGELATALAALCDAALLTCRGTPPEASYRFKHALVCDAAYATLLRGRRRQLHAAIARELDIQPSGRAASQELLAHHRTQAGLYRDAVRAWKAAARDSVACGSFAEAQAQLHSGLALLEQMPNDAERDRQEAALQNALGNVLIAQRGYNAPQTMAAFERARDLAATLDDSGQGLRALWGLGTALLFAGRLGAVLNMMQDAAPLVEKNGHLDARLAFSVVHGSVMLDRGRLNEARGQLETTLAMDNDPGRDRERAILYGQSPRISALGHLSIASLLLDQPQRSLEQSQQSVSEAQALSHKPMLCLAHGLACRRHWLAGDKQHLARHALELQRLASDQGTPLWLALGKVFGGWSLVEGGTLEAGVALIAQGVAAYRASGADSAMPLLLLALGRAYARTQRTTEALVVLAEALRGGNAGDERWIEAEVHRERGEILARQRDFAAAELAFHSAISTARGQEARLFELRAEAGLTRMLFARAQSRVEPHEPVRPLHLVTKQP